MSREQNAEQNQNTNVGNKSFEILTEFKHLETALAYQSSIYEETKLHYEKLYDL
jgi:hypothetical protein